MTFDFQANTQARYNSALNFFAKTTGTLWCIHFVAFVANHTHIFRQNLFYICKTTIAFIFPLTFLNIVNNVKHSSTFI